VDTEECKFLSKFVYLQHNMTKKLLSTQECKEIYGLSRATLINYEKKGLIKPLRTPGGIRRYKVEDIEKLFGMSENKQEEASNSC
jgi:hypothetical protein